MGFVCFSKQDMNKNQGQDPPPNLGQKAEKLRENEGQLGLRREKERKEEEEEDQGGF